MERENLIFCKKCNRRLDIEKIKPIWDENSSYGSTKYIICPRCKGTTILEVIEDEYDNIHDYRFYTYTK